jgi:hypothetical protein
MLYTEKSGNPAKKAYLLSNSIHLSVSIQNGKINWETMNRLFLVHAFVKKYEILWLMLHI